jgi:hypothetical protein
MHRSSVAAIALVVWLVVGCATPPPPPRLSVRPQPGGVSEPIAWEVADAQIVPGCGGGQAGFGWIYTVVFKDLGGRSIRFDTVEMTAGGDNVRHHSATQRFRRTLEARSELRAPFLYCALVEPPQSSRAMPAPGRGWIDHRFRGRDETGRALEIDIRVLIEPQ